MYNRTEFIAIPCYRISDTIIGTIYIICFIFGVPANILSSLYFRRKLLKHVELTTSLYALTSLQDAAISLVSLMHGVILLKEREDILKGFCPVQHVLFQIFQRMSVLLVAALSVTRTYKLVYPFKIMGLS